jgi:hypothetical protein
MSWFPDMGTVTMIDAGDHVRAVGWLSANHRVTKGSVPIEFLARLRVFTAKWRHSGDALGWGTFKGLHTCELCFLRRFTAGGNFGVPHGELLFAVPEMIYHNVKAHRYHPPDEFIAAVMQSPIPGTDEYRVLVEPFRRLHERSLQAMWSAEPPAAPDRGGTQRFGVHCLTRRGR